MTEEPTFKTALFNGVGLTCPRCGKGRLFSSYLKRVDACPHCRESFVGLDADDGPAWLTIVLSTHAFGPVFMLLDQQASLSIAAETGLGVAALTALVLFLLPRAKGLFVAQMWWLERRPGLAATPG